MIKLHFDIEPKAIQSFRVARMGRHIRKYQPKANTEYKDYLKYMAMSQLKEKYLIEYAPVFPIGPVHVHTCVYTFAYLKSHSKKKRALDILYKDTKPDLIDNLFKGLGDALSGVIWKDDAQIAKCSNLEKRFGDESSIYIEISEL